jgi:hypothetical protein
MHQPQNKRVEDGALATPPYAVVGALRTANI